MRLLTRCCCSRRLATPPPCLFSPKGGCQGPSAAHPVWPKNKAVRRRAVSVRWVQCIFEYFLFRIWVFSVPDPHQRILGILALGNMIRVVQSRSWIRILIFYPSRIQGSKGHRFPDPHTASVLLLKRLYFWFLVKNISLDMTRAKNFATFADQRSGALLTPGSGGKNPDPDPGWKTRIIFPSA
jgi:hypothetical protein